MFKRRVRLPSPAIVISMVALSLVLGGTAVAASTGGHADAAADKALVKKLAPTLSVKNAKQLGGKAASSYALKNAIMWAVVTNDGTTATVSRSTPGVSAARNGTGDVNVTFPRDVSRCAWTATQGNPSSSFVPSDFATVRGSGIKTQVQVVTYNTTGSQVDVDFHLLVTC
jgi:hypothetical protein